MKDNDMLLLGVGAVAVYFLFIKPKTTAPGTLLTAANPSGNSLLALPASSVPASTSSAIVSLASSLKQLISPNAPLISASPSGNGSGGAAPISPGSSNGQSIQADEDKTFQSVLNQPLDLTPIFSPAPAVSPLYTSGSQLADDYTAEQQPTDMERMFESGDYTAFGCMQG